MKSKSKPKVKFAAKRGRIDQPTVQKIDIDHILATEDVKLLQTTLENITYSKFEQSDLDRMD